VAVFAMVHLASLAEADLAWGNVIILGRERSPSTLSWPGNRRAVMTLLRHWMALLRVRCCGMSQFWQAAKGVFMSSRL